MKKVFLVRKKDLTYDEMIEFANTKLRRIINTSDMNFPNFVNKFNLKKFFNTFKVEVGSKVRFMTNEEDFYFDFVPGMEKIKNSIQEISEIRNDGRIFLKNQEKYEFLQYSYSIYDIVEVIN